MLGRMGGPFSLTDVDTLERYIKNKWETGKVVSGIFTESAD